MQIGEQAETSSCNMRRDILGMVKPYDVYSRAISTISEFYVFHLKIYSEFTPLCHFTSKSNSRKIIKCNTIVKVRTESSEVKLVIRYTNRIFSDLLIKFSFNFTHLLIHK